MSKEPPKDWLHPGYSHSSLRKWQRDNSILLKSNLQLPVFVCDEPNAKQEIKTLPEHYRWGVNRLSELLDPLVKKGLESVLLFGVLTDEKDPKASLKFQKDNLGSIALSNSSPVILAISFLKQRYPQLLISCDVCLCAYTDHGHCGLLNKDGYIDNKASIEQIAELAAHYARAGAHIVAPSDMMDGRTKAIKAKLYEYGLAGRCAVMSYAAKYCSSFLWSISRCL